MTINLYKNFKFIFLVLFLCSCTESKFYGHVYDYDTEKPIKNVSVYVNGRSTKTDSTGYFSINIKSNLPNVIQLKKEGYFSKKVYRKADSLGRFDTKNINWNVIYLYNKESDFSPKIR